MFRFATRTALTTLLLALAAWTASPAAAQTKTDAASGPLPRGKERQSVRSGSLSISATGETNPDTIKEASLPVIALDASNIREIPRAEKTPIRDGKRDIPLTSPVPGGSLAARLTDADSKTLQVWRPAFATQGFRGARLDAFAVSQDGSVLAIAERTGIATGPNGTRVILINTHTWDVLRIFTTDYRLGKLAFVPDANYLAAVALPQPALNQELMIVGFDLGQPECPLRLSVDLTRAQDASFQPEKIALIAKGSDVFCTGYNGRKVFVAHIARTANDLLYIPEFEAKAPVSAMAVTPDGSRVALASQKAIEYFAFNKNSDGKTVLNSVYTVLDLGWQPVDLQFLGGAMTDFIVCPSFDEDSPPVIVRSSAKDSLDGRSAGFAVPVDGGRRVGVAFKVKSRIDVVNPATIEVEESLILDQMKPQTSGTPLFVFYNEAIRAFCVVDTVGNAYAVGKKEGEKRWNKRIIWNGAGKR